VINFPSYRSSLVTRAKTTAGNYNINTASLKTLIIPQPPIELQNQFATIVEKVEGIKSCYQESLTDLETLYGALNQKAFNGELDLSRVPLPSDNMEATAEEKVETNEPQETTDAPDLPAPSDIATLNSTEGRIALLDQWLTVWIERKNNAPLSIKSFMEEAQQRLWDIAEDNQQELGLEEYDQIKARVFDAIERGQLEQTRNKVMINEKLELGNRVVLVKAVQDRQG
jgi:type I restriction enzyme, S subunit